MFTVALDVDPHLLAALDNPDREIGNMLRGLFLDVDRLLFGEGKELDLILKKSGPPLTPHYKSWKIRKMSQAAEIEENISSLRKRRSRRVTAEMRAAAIKEQEGFLEGAKVKPFRNIEPEPLTVRSADVWVRTGKFAEQVIRAELTTKGKSRGSVTETGLRKVVIEINPQRGEYGVQIDERIGYWRYANERRPLLEWTPELKRKVEQLAAKWVKSLGAAILGTA